MTPERDRDLAQRFDRLKREDAAAAPPFRLDSGESRQASRLRLAFGHWLAMGGAVALTFALFLCPPTMDREDPRPSIHEAAFDSDWNAPSDFLSPTRNRDLMAGLPQLTVAIPRYPNFEGLENRPETR